MQAIALRIKNLKISTIKNPLNVNLYIHDTISFISKEKSKNDSLKKALLNHFKIESGQILYFNRPLKEMNYILNFIGYFSLDIIPYSHLSCFKYLDYIYSFYVGSFRDKILNTLSYFNLEKNKKIKDLTKDELNIIRFIEAILHEPEILILDGFYETNLYKNDKVMNLIKKMKKDGILIIIFSQNTKSIKDSNKVFYDIDDTYKEDLELTKKILNTYKIILDKNVTLNDSHIIKIENNIIYYDKNPSDFILKNHLNPTGIESLDLSEVNL